MDAYAILGLGRKLVIDADMIRDAFQETARRAHPDAGGRREDFEMVEQASALLLEPGRRLGHWLELGAIEGSLRGPVADEVMEIFTEVGPVLQTTDELLRERERTTSMLAKALLEPRVMAARETLEQLQERLEEAGARRTALFPVIETGEEDGWRIARELAFFAKWRAQVRERFAGLW